MSLRDTLPNLPVLTADELINATRNAGACRIVVRGNLKNLPSIYLAPGQSLCGEDDRSSIVFANGIDGLQLSTDNEISNLALTASPDQRVMKRPKPGSNVARNWNRRLFI